MGLLILQVYVDKIQDQIEQWRNAKGAARGPILDAAVNILMEEFAELSDKTLLKKVTHMVYCMIIMLIQMLLQALGTYFSNHYRLVEPKVTIPGKKKRSAREVFQEENKEELKKLADQRTGGRGLANKEIGAFSTVVSEYWAKLTEEQKAAYQKKADEYNAHSHILKAGSSE